MATQKGIWKKQAVLDLIKKIFKIPCSLYKVHKLQQAHINVFTNLCISAYCVVKTLEIVR